ncbi:MAG: hypothetical protein GYA55_02665 [SAR324 cluster bacterium]|uniref:DUF4292 domain-containing protein n=1 Tax=SAR324 cluster bacterium TaxID=2024889 RepID=A0A7X9FPN7_9DELT|nr:hypothetical protein [SAR324 cluster bacterium]
MNRGTVNILEVIFLLGMFLATSCAPKQIILPQIQGRALTPEERQVIFNSLQEKFDAVQSAKILYDANFTNRDETQSLRLVAVFEKPEHLRLETFPDTSFLSLQLMVMNGTIVSLIDNTSHKAFLTNNAERLLRRFLKLPIGAADLIAILSGRISATDLKKMRSGENFNVYANEELGRYLISKGDGDIIWEVNKFSLQVEDVVYRNIFNDEVILRAHCNDIINEGAIQMPSNINIEVPGERLQFDFKARTSRINQTIPENLFEVEIPSGFSVEVIDE